MTKLSFRLSVSLTVFLFSCPLYPQIQWGAPAIFIFHIVDSYGRPVGYKIESFHEIGKSAKDFKGQIQGLTVKGVTQGKIYVIRMIPTQDSQKFTPFEKQIAAAEATAFMVFAVRELHYQADRDEPPPVTHFIIKPAPSGKQPVWVTVSPAFGPEVDNGHTEAVPLDRNGEFTLHGTHGGTYIVSLCQGTKVTKLAVVDIPFTAPEKAIEITLK